MKAPIATDPTREHRLNPAGNFLQGEVIAMMQPPATYPLMHRFGRFVAHGGSKTHEELSFTPPRRPRAKCIPQEVKALLNILSRPFDDQPECAAFTEPAPDSQGYRTFCGT
jgi:hypothetical protein